MPNDLSSTIVILHSLFELGEEHMLSFQENSLELLTELLVSKSILSMWYKVILEL